MQLLNDTIPSFLEIQIDEAISRDFELKDLNEDDFSNNSFQSMSETLRFNSIPILYKRKVISRITPVVPKVQYLFGFSPVDGLCILTKNHVHKEILCNGKLFEMYRHCNSFIHSLQYLLVERDTFNVWGYIPLVPAIDRRDIELDLRKKLFSS